MEDVDLIRDLTFHLGKEDLENVLAVALENGGDFADIYVEHRVENRYSLSENKICDASMGVDMGVGIRVINGDKTGYSYSSDFNVSNLEETARIASMVAAGKVRSNIAGLNKIRIPSYYLVERPCQQVFATPGPS